MPIYVYQSIDREEQFEFTQSMEEPPYTHHPVSGIAICRVIQAPAVHLPGLKRSTVVNKRSAAATACGCASNAALAGQLSANSRRTPTYSLTKSKKAITKKALGHTHGGNCKHSH